MSVKQSNSRMSSPFKNRQINVAPDGGIRTVSLGREPIEDRSDASVDELLEVYDA